MRKWKKKLQNLRREANIFYKFNANFKMKLFDLNNFITLVLISKIEEFRDSYSLSKVLAWKFGIITVLEITNKLENDELISRKSEQGISKYEITKKGKEFIEVNMIKGKALMLEKHKEEQSFITALLNR